MEHWIIYDLETGEALSPGSGSPGTAAYQKLPDGCGITLVPWAIVSQFWPPQDLDPFRAVLIERVDAQAEFARSRYVTALPAQVGTYLLKEAAAQRWLADQGESTAMLQPEATARGMTLEALAAEVVANAAAWAHLAGAIEGLRFAAKARIAAANTIGAIAEAAVIDWSALDAPAA